MSLRRALVNMRVRAKRPELIPFETAETKHRPHFSMRVISTIDADDLARHISCLDHPHHRFRDLLRPTHSSDRQFYIPTSQHSIPSTSTKGKDSTHSA